MAEYIEKEKQDLINFQKELKTCTNPERIEELNGLIEYLQKQVALFDELWAEENEIEEDKKVKEEVEPEPEKLPTQEEIVAVIGISLENCIEPPKVLEDEQGLYLLEAKVTGENEGEVIEYMYNRQGEFSTHKSSGTSIYKTVYDKEGDFVKYPEHIAEYNPETGEWKNVK